MTLVRLVARPMLASMFVTGGLDALLNPASRIGGAVDDAPNVAPKVVEPIPGLPDQDPELLIRINGGVQVGAGMLFALGYAPRLSALALAATLVPTTAAAHRYWELDDPTQRQEQRVHFIKNVSMLGGLLIAAVDTEGRPGLAWRTRAAATGRPGVLWRTRAATSGRPGIAWRTQTAVDRAETAVRRSRREARLAARAAGANAGSAVLRGRRDARLAGKAARTKLGV